jgi:putative hydrolase of the HAD superfamily
MSENVSLQIKGILFDLWGTLAYNIPRRNRSDFDELAREIGYSTDEVFRVWANFAEDAQRGKLKSAEERAARVLATLGAPTTLAARFAQFEYDQRAADTHLYPGVPELLGQLRQLGYQTTLISNCNYLTREVVERLGLPQMLDAIILSCEVGHVKPEREIYETAAAGLGLTPHECAFVGDGGDGEMTGARLAGCAFRVLVEQERGHSYRFPAKNYEVDARIPKISELLKVLPQRRPI